MLLPDRPRFTPPLGPAKAFPSAFTPAQLLAVRQFVARVGGLENARQALEMLAVLSRTPKAS